MEREIRGIIRIAGKDINGNLSLYRGLTRIRGVGINLGKILANIVLREMKLPDDMKIGALREDEIERLEEILKNPSKYNIYSYLLNRRRDFDTGKDIHIVGSDLMFMTKQDISRGVNTRTWKGYRHSCGQKVRGQRTRTTGRKGLTVGVIRKKLLPGTAAASAAGAAEKAQEKKAEKTAEKKVEKPAPAPAKK